MLLKLPRTGLQANDAPPQCAEEKSKMRSLGIDRELRLAPAHIVLGHRLCDCGFCDQESYVW
jgi:hypothetical protein